MRRRLAITALVLLGAAPMSGQQLENNRPERYPAGSVGEASRQHALTLSEVHRLLDVYDTLKAQKARGVALREPSIPDSASLAEGIAEVERSPAVMQAVTAARFSPSEFVVVSAAFVEAFETMMLQRIMGPYTPPTRGRWENVALYRANQAELDKRLGVDKMGGDAGDSRAARQAMAAEPGTAGAAAATHVLTIEELRRLVSMLGDLASLAVKSVDVSVLLQNDDPVTPLDARVASLARSTEIGALAAKYGFTVRQYLVANAAFEELLEAAMTPDPVPSGTRPTSARAKNVALYRQHQGEIDALMMKIVARGSREEHETLKGDTLYQRRLRQTDSLSRFVRTDSLARLFLAGLSASEDALPALGQEVTCETTRLHWRHGIAPAAAAIRRMRDSLWQGRDEDYRRSNDRLYPYALSAPMTDAVCGQSRWPRAADSLNVIPRPRDPGLK